MARLARLVVLVAIVIGWAVALRPVAMAGPATYIVVRGDSMLPTYQTGDLLVLHTAESYGDGDAIGYRVPSGELGEGRVVVHRIQSGDAQRGFVLQGDNNPAPDPWTPRANDVVGTVWLALPGVGRFILWVHQPATIGAIAAALAVAATLVFGGRVPLIPLPTWSGDTRRAGGRSSRWPASTTTASTLSRITDRPF